MSDLKPCPFCGCVAIHNGVNNLEVLCTGCMAAVPAAVWNERTNTDGWIAFSERKPEEGQNIAMIAANGQVGNDRYSQLTFSACWTHWHPLPPPPKRDLFAEWLLSVDSSDLSYTEALRKAFEAGRKAKE